MGVGLFKVFKNDYYLSFIVWWTVQLIVVDVWNICDPHLLYDK